MNSWKKIYNFLKTTLKTNRLALKRILRFLNEKLLSREIYVLKVVNAPRCPNIVEYREDFIEDNYHFIATEYCEVPSNFRIILKCNIFNWNNLKEWRSQKLFNGS